MSNHILISGTGSAHNKQLRNFVDSLWEVQQTCQRIKATYDQAAAGGDWQSLATLLDILSVEDAEDIYNLIGSVETELEAPFITQLLSRLG